MTTKQISLIRRCYQLLANMYHEWPERNSPCGQQLLCDLRDTLAKETRKTDEEIQNSVIHFKVKSHADRQLDTMAALTLALHDSPLSLHEHLTRWAKERLNK